ncbi:hypothetical protein SEMRO_1166_G248240.1 [Seminavis robusta]|uniref:Uncharacterized protein n=1 Tax=Seminavis robusta TaxID=568900 RepID=A0A9N8EM94_9STRA|nr:hypothetical protein SEMRO_1166_G248240.1 [Seminavis robusta]|eukprot:Sro1166_g248240.1 n/a (288) ;mRNA; f:16735-17598
MSPQKWDENHPARILLCKEIKEGRIPMDSSEMGPAEVYYKYHDTVEFQVEGMEYNSTFTSRLRRLREQIKRGQGKAEKGTKTKKKKKEISLTWNENHPARILLYKEIAEGRIPLNEQEMGPAEVWCTYHNTLEFQMDGMEFNGNFATRLSSLRAIVKRDQGRAASDRKALEKAMKNHPVPELNHRGEPQWNGSLAQALLQQDMVEGKHETIRPSELWETRPEYKEAFSRKNDFRWKIRQEIRTKKYLYTLEYRAEEKLRKNLKKEGIVLPDQDEAVGGIIMDLEMER